MTHVALTLVHQRKLFGHFNIEKDEYDWSSNWVTHFRAYIAFIVKKCNQGKLGKLKIGFGMAQFRVSAVTKVEEELLSRER